MDLEKVQIPQIPDRSVPVYWTGADGKVFILTPMQETILELMCQGLRPAEVGKVLKKSPTTILTHLCRVRKRFGHSSWFETFVRYHRRRVEEGIHS